jgi:hypothetical protein
MTTEHRSTTRRALLGAGLGSLAALVVEAFRRPSPVRAEGETIHVGDNHFTAETATYLKNTTTDADVFIGNTTKSGRAFYGKSTGGTAIEGRTEASSPRAGLSGVTSAAAGVAVRGVNEATNAYGALAVGKTGVHGSTGDGSAVSGSAGIGTGVDGSSESGIGVDGSSSYGIGVHAGSSAGKGTALHVDGTTVFTRSGIASIPAGQSHVIVSVSSLMASSFVLATLQQYRSGVWVAAVVKNVPAGTLTIRLSSTVGVETRVAYLISEVP